MQKLRMSDNPNKTRKNSEFLIPQRTQEKFQNFWSPQLERQKFRIFDPPKNPNKNSEFLIPQEHKKNFRISDPL